MEEMTKKKENRIGGAVPAAEENNGEALEKLTAQRHHRAVLSWLHVSGETVQFLEKIPDGLVCECLYLCVIDGMPLSDLQKICNVLAGTSREKAEIILQERQRYLQKLYGETSVMGKQIDELYQEAKQVFSESQKVQKSVEQHMTYTLEMQKTLLEEQKESNKISLSSKDEVIREKDKQMQKLEQDIRSLQETEASMREENRQIRQKLLEQETEKAAVLTEKEEILLPQDADNAPDPTTEKVELEGETSKEPPRRNGFRAFFRKSRREKESREFIETFLSDKEYSQEQREYLLRCLEEGDRVRKIQQFASPKLTVEQMERMRKLSSR